MHFSFLPRGLPKWSISSKLAPSLGRSESRSFQNCCRWVPCTSKARVSWPSSLHQFITIIEYEKYSMRWEEEQWTPKYRPVYIACQSQSWIGHWHNWDLLQLRDTCKSDLTPNRFDAKITRFSGKCQLLSEFSDRSDTGRGGFGGEKVCWREEAGANLRSWSDWGYAGSDYWGSPQGIGELQSRQNQDSRLLLRVRSCTAFIGLRRAKMEQSCSNTDCTVSVEGHTL